MKHLFINYKAQTWYFDICCFILQMSVSFLPIFLKLLADKLCFSPGVVGDVGLVTPISES